MQSATPEFEDAVEDASISWVPPILEADWDGDGYGGAGTIDRLPVGTAFSVEHSLDDGYPSAVSTSVASDPTGTLSAGLLGARVNALKDLRFLDNYNRTSAGFWNNIEVGGVVWQHPNGGASDYPISAGTARIVNPDTIGLRHAFIDIDSTNFLLDVAFQFGVASATGNAVTVWLIGRATDMNNYYAAELQLLGSDVTLRLWKRVAGGLGFLDSLPPQEVAGTNTASTNWWRITFQAVGGKLLATAENTSTNTGVVQIFGEDNDLATGDLAGVATRREGGNTNGTVTVQFDAFKATVPIAEEMDPRQYYSPYNTNSPIQPYDRDVAPVRIEHGLLTENGEERIRLFTGQMANVSISGRTATLQAISATRFAMAKALKPPVVNGTREGANATWLVNWVLHQCGMDVAPAPRPGCRLWMPFHGSLHPFEPYSNSGPLYELREYTASGTYQNDRPTFVEGPYSLAAYAEQPSATRARRIVISSLPLTPGEQILSQQGNRGRVEFWVRGDTIVDPGPAGTQPLALFLIRSAGSVQIAAEISSGRNVRLQIHDGVSNKVYSPGMPIPADGDWHAVGMAWDLAGNKAWLYLDGVENSSTSLALTTSSLPTSESLDSGTPEFYSLIPVSDFHFTTGTDANPDNVPWLDEGMVIPGAVVAYEDFEDTVYSVTIGGNWYRYPAQSGDSGGWVFRSGSIQHTQQSDCTITVPTGAATVSFWYKSSSEQYWDYFQFINNGVLQFEVSGDIGWQKSAEFAVTPGQTLTFRYIKDESVSEFADAAFIDRVEFRSASSLVAFDPGAISRPVDMEFEAIAEPVAREAWDIVHQIALSTISAIRTDELDRFNFLPPGYFVEAAQLVNVADISTDLNAEDIEFSLDPSRIRNSVQVNFDEAYVDSKNVFVLALGTATLVRPGNSVMTFSFSEPVVAIDSSINVVTTFTSTTVESVVSFNSVEDGSGTYYTSSLVEVTVEDWDAGSITLRFQNDTGRSVFIVNNANNERPYLGIAGFAVHFQSASATVTDLQSRRPERSVEVSASALQRRVDAFTLASMVLGATRLPRPEVSVTTLGDPRRQPGDLVSLLDEQGLCLSGNWRIMSIDHKREGAQYTQDLKLRQELPISLWDDADTGWDEGVWSA